MTINWLKVPSKYRYAHESQIFTGETIFTSCAMLEHGRKLLFPDNVIVECHLAKGVHGWPDTTMLQLERQRMSEPVWDLLPEELTCLRIHSDDTISANESCCTHDQVELIRRMNLAVGTYVRPDAVPEPVGGTCITMATEVMLKQRAKGIEKYGSSIEAQNSYDIPAMVRMAQEEMADGAVYLAKVQLMIERLRHLADHGDIESIRKGLGA